MTPSLHELQAGMARAVLLGDMSAAAWIVTDGIAGADRLAIHANHYRLSLIEALATTFAPVRRLVGEDFFDALARRYVLARPPEQPCLAAYGADFADFAAADPAAASVPFLPCIARFAFALNLAATAPLAPALPPAALAGLGEAALARLTLRPAPGVSALRSPYPVQALWRLATSETEAAPAVDLDAPGECLVVWPAAGRPAWTQVEAGDHAFLAALTAGSTLGEAAAAAAARDPMFHLAGLLGLALRERWFAAITRDGTTEEGTG